MNQASWKAVVFDMDGTLVDSLALVPEAYVKTIRDLGGPEVARDDIVATWHIGPAPVLLQHYLGRTASRSDLECYFRHLESVVADIRPFPGVDELLAALRAQGFALGVYTTAMRRAAEVTLAAAGVAAFFGAFVGGDDVSRPKPSGEGLVAACTALGARPEETVFVGDSAADLGCAADAGALAIHALWAPQAREVAGEHRRAEEPGEVLRVLESMPPI